jgi:hypothetical protein
VPFFLKQLGRTPVVGGSPISLNDKHVAIGVMARRSAHP